MLSEVGMEGGKVIVLARDSGAVSGVSMEDLSIDSFRGVNAALDHGDLSIEGVTDVRAGLGASLLVKVGYRVVVGVRDIILGPVALDDALRVFLIVAFLGGIFYCRDMTQQ